jgi:MoxR-like ATPase
VANSVRGEPAASSTSEVQVSESVQTDQYEAERRAVEQLRAARGRIREELDKVLVGQHDVTEQLLVSLFAGGHCLITGAPGLAKTLLVRSLAQVFHLKFQRIQFTPDLMPADITGVEILEDVGDGKRRMQFVKGPVFANVLLADEINRTPPKTQAALLEAMQEHQVTAAGVRYPLEEPFFVLATQNPIEMEGTYPLPEAQLDRFMFNVVVDYLPENDEVEVVKRTTGGKPKPIQPLFTGEDILRFHEVVRKVPVAEDVVRYAVRLAAASRPGQPATPDFVKQHVAWGAGLRAAQFLVLGGKARALLAGRAHVSADDIKALALPTFRHRILVNYRAEAEGVTVETVIQRLLETVKRPG